LLPIRPASNQDKENALAKMDSLAYSILMIRAQARAAEVRGAAQAVLTRGFAHFKTTNKSKDNL